MKSRGFTLVELLLVIVVIITILASSFQGLRYYRWQESINTLNQSLQQLQTLSEQYYFANCNRPDIVFQSVTLNDLKQWALNSQVYTVKQLQLIQNPLGDPWQVSYIQVAPPPQARYMIQISANFTQLNHEQLQYLQEKMHANGTVTQNILAWTFFPQQIYKDKASNTFWVANNSLRFFARTYQSDQSPNSYCG